MATKWLVHLLKYFVNISWLTLLDNQNVFYILNDFHLWEFIPFADHSLLKINFGDDLAQLEKVFWTRNWWSSKALFCFTCENCPLHFTLTLKKREQAHFHSLCRKSTTFLLCTFSMTARWFCATCPTLSGSRCRLD